jgi:CBS domain-containing protein
MATESVRDVMRKGVVSCAPQMTLRDAAKLMTQANVRALVVMNSDCGLTGIVSTSDLVNATLDKSFLPENVTVKDVMTPSVLTVTPDESVSVAAKLMIDRHVHRLVVVENKEENCMPIGILSMGDIVRSISED